MQQSNAIVPGSLSAVAQRNGASLAESFVSCDAIIIVDVSGSMAIEDSRGGKSRYDVALEELAQLQAHMPGKLGVLAFSDQTQFVPGGQPPFMGGNTNLAGALQFAKVADVPGAMRFVIISDGEPNDENQALAVAQSYRNRIDVVYVGPEAMPAGREFLKRLAATSGGQAITADRAHELATKTEHLLSSGA